MTITCPCGSPINVLDADSTAFDAHLAGDCGTTPQPAHTTRRARLLAAVTRLDVAHRRAERRQWVMKQAGPASLIAARIYTVLGMVRNLPYPAPGRVTPGCEGVTRMAAHTTETFTCLDCGRVQTHTVSLSTRNRLRKTGWACYDCCMKRIAAGK
jgi:hypothetical protein